MGDSFHSNFHLESATGEGVLQAQTDILGSFTTQDFPTQCFSLIPDQVQYLILQIQHKPIIIMIVMYMHAYVFLNTEFFLPA